MVSFRNALIALCAAGSIALAASPVRAQSPEDIKTARQTAGDALTAYQAGEFDKALDLFTKARALYPSAQIVRMLGYSELALEHWEKALEALEASLESKVGPLSKEDRKEVQDQINKALIHIGTVTVTSKVAGAKVSVDGGPPRALPLEKPLHLAEGQRKLVVSAPDRLDATSDVKVEGGKAVEIALEPAEKPKAAPPPPPPPPPPPVPDRKEWVPHQKLVGYGAAGLGGAFGVAAVITATQWGHWKSLAKTDYDLHIKNYGQGCAKGDPRLCAYDITVTNREADTANRLRNASIGLGVTAGVLAAAGVVFVVMAPKQKAPASDEAPAAAPATARGPSLSCGPAGGLGVLCSGEF
ncbi:Dihydrolipoamide acetyltransferase [Minicystis rosea]|nr:Dihydrolipoamide acetyltransferase [Minicystis rosea]